MKANSILRGGDDKAASMVRALDLAGTAGDAAEAHAMAKESTAQLSPLEREAAGLREALAAAEARYAKMLPLAREQGREDALAAFKRDDSRALEALEAGIASALTTFKTEIQQLERLSLALCDTALSKVLGDPKRRTELVSEAIIHQLNIVKTNSVLAIRVSASDFPDLKALARLTARVGVAPDALQYKADMRAGECEIMMRLGHIEVSIPDYLQHLRRALVEAGSQGLGAT